MFLCSEDTKPDAGVAVGRRGAAASCRAKVVRGAAPVPATTHAVGSILKNRILHNFFSNKRSGDEGS